eukprot:CCRYP_010185-RA/>CCRYP_010185-RA protein AED:0.27 eAED:0.27 QI:0/0/0/1/0/0/3/0/273
MTSEAAAQKRVNDHAAMMAKKAAYKKATTIYDSEKTEGLSAKQVSQLVLGEFGVEIKPRTIQRAIQEGRIGVSPKKMGPQGYLPPKTFDHLTTAFESYIKIMQLNGHGGAVTNNKLLIILKKCTSPSITKCNRGGRPEVIFYSPYLPNLGKATIKNGTATTMIAGSTAAGEPIPPHLQFQTRAQSVDTQSININLVTFLPNIIGKFGTEEKREWAVTFGYNAKGGMDNEHFKEYIRTNIAPLYPDAEDKVSKRVMVKVDSGPGRLEIDFLAEA